MICGFFTWFFIRMKKIMFDRNKSKVCLWVFLSFVFWFLGIWYVNASTFSERLSDVGIDVVSFSNKNSISRYEVARLLNAANCQDCVQAPDWMRKKYDEKFWNDFTAIDGKDFDDIGYEAWIWNKKSYYYCVAYVWDNGYMVWYPSTSTKCKWSFCGQEMITTSEFYQTVLNIIQDQIRQRYLINWSKVKSWKKWLKKNSIQMRVLNQNNIDVIDKAESKIAYAQNNDEFQTWLKYCMYNLSECNFQSFGIIWTWYWPVSELNVLYREWVISLQDAENVASFPNMKWDEAIRIFSAVYDNYASCSFNVDYDCDWVMNWKDNCPYVFNPNQYDLDTDKIWNVCDDDIDWDWKKNPIWIVDDNNNIIVSLWDNKLDQTPLGDRDSGFSFFINVDNVSIGFPTSVRFSPLTDGNIARIEWDFGDWTRETVDNWDKVNHVFRESGLFTVKAVAISKNWAKSFAMTKIFITDSRSENYALNIKPSLVFKNWGAEYTFTPLYSGDLDKISWQINDEKEKSQKLTESFKVTIKENGRYVVTAKWYKNWELKAVAMFTVLQNWSPKFSSIDVKVWNLWEESSITSNLVWILKKDVDHVSVNRWWINIDSTNLVQKYSYDEAWLKTIQYKLVLKDWITLYNLATITVQNPLLNQSYAVNVVWDRLTYDQGEKLSLWLSVYPRTSVMSLFTSYQLWQKKFLYNPDFSKLLLDYAYSNAWDKLLTNSVEINRCVALLNQWTVHINSVDICESAMKSKTLSNYKCDQDGDKILDICDDDIDWDGIKNLIGLILYENKDCSIWENNINSDLLKKQLWVCSLDNCPFVVNSNQSDLNNNWIWELCEDPISKLLSSSLRSSEWSNTLVLESDQDWDWVADNMDDCVDIPWNSSNWCPEYYTQSCWVYSTCWNGKVDEWEDCQNCPQDVWVCCGNGILDSWESCETCPQDAGDCSLCWNGKIDDWENCKNCEKDVWKCTAYCWNWEIEAAEDCRNCEKDVWKCSATCGDGNIQIAEDCKNCNKDVKMCRSDTCGNWEVEEWAWEECDSWKDKEGKSVKCTKMCTIYDSNKPNCGNGKIDKWEDCKTCPVDLWEKCVANWDKEEKPTCWNGVLDDDEQCDFKDKYKKNWWTEWCSNSCQQMNKDWWECNSEYDWKNLKSLLNSSELCTKWSMEMFSFNPNKLQWSWLCVNKNSKYSIKCYAKKSGCGDLSIWSDEKCNNCSLDLKDICITDWNDWGDDEDCDCGECPEKLKYRCVTDWDDDEDCGCDECPEKLKYRCVTDWDDDEDCGCDECPEKLKYKCVDDWDDDEDCGCDECPEKLKEKCIKPHNPETPRIIKDPEEPENPDDNIEWHVENNNCNTCPCEYVDFSTDLTKWDTVRAKLWDKSLSVFYRYSNSTAVESFLGDK